MTIATVVETESFGDVKLWRLPDGCNGVRVGGSEGLDLLSLKFCLNSGFADSLLRF